jgi:uncharacterized protein YjeT (DUF2065 family)
MALDRAHRSLYYPATYLVATGLALLAVPDLSLKLFFSNGHYGDVMPRMVGAVLLALGIIVIQIIRHRVEGLYPTVVGVRVMLCTAWVGLYAYTRDPFFLIVLGVVAAGTVWTAVSLARDRAS